MLGARQRLVAIGTSVALVAAAGTATGAPATAGRPTPKAPRAYLIHLIDGGDPIVVQKYVEQDGQIRFEKYGGWVSIPSYEVRRIVPDDAEETPSALPPADVPPQPDTLARPDTQLPVTPSGVPAAPLYVTTRGGATIRASSVAAAGQDVRVGTPEGSLTFRRTDLVGVLRVPSAPAPPEAWITLWGGEDDSGVGGPPGPPSDVPPSGALPTLSDRPHLLELANGVVMQVDGFWVEGGEIRFRRLGGVVGFALNEIAKLLPQETESVRGRLPARFVRRLGPDRVEVRLQDGVRRIRLIGIDPILGASEVLEDPWTALDRGLVVYLEFDRERYRPDGDWLAYLYLPNGRMLNAELIRVGLAEPRAETNNIRYLDLFREIQAHQ
jgi:hypothetical protein